MPRSHPLIGKAAPQLSLPDSNGQTYTLSPDTLAKPVVIFFYPKAGTYGCTKEACEFRDALVEKESFKTTKAQVIGISGDSVEKQKEFVTKQNLPYPVLSDAGGEARKVYQVGKSLLGLSDNRMTFVIDSKGIVRDVHDGTINFWSHVKFVNKWLERLEEEGKPHTAPVEPGLMTDPALATEPEPHTELPIVSSGPVLSAPSDDSPAVSPADSNDPERENLAKAAAAVQG